VFLAEEQTSGRGRNMRGWHSERSLGIYCSVILRPRYQAYGISEGEAMAPAHTLLLSLSAGMAAQTAVEAVTSVRPDLRWPNDLLISEKKVGGILAEASTDGDQVRFAVLGVGLNVNQEAFPPELEPIASSLRRETGRRWPRVELAAALLESLDREYRLFCSGLHENILRRFEQRSSYARGKRVRVEENGGFEGVTDGLDELGLLRVRTGKGVQTVVSGGVRPLE
jgi:BirA family biotin operon repressor/biotin-[acetyl-CoA-carboxylase] ligase